MEFAARNLISCSQSLPYEINLYDLALCIYNNNNHINFGGHILSLFVSLVATFAPSLRSGANNATRATNILYALHKSCDCPISEFQFEAAGV